MFVSNMAYCQTDKLLHASAGFVSASITSAVFQHYNLKHPILIGFGVGTCLGVGKEVYDKVSGRGTPETMDAAFTIAGAALGSFTVKLTIPNKQKDKQKEIKKAKVKDPEIIVGI